MIMFWLGESDWLTLFVFLAASTAGFLLWNWPPAKIFMGDSGSGFLGFTLAILAIMTSIDGPINIWSWLILLGVFIVDATITLLRRAINGESWYRAHRSHAYQILASRLGSHKKVTVGTMVLNIIWLLPLAYLASIYPYWGAALCLVAWMPLVVLAFVVGSGRTEISSA
jgi:Fuc2NAc and GlcNAc transferase